MTLCLAWKRGDFYTFASDSRLSNGNTVVSDIATKIFTLDVNIFLSTQRKLVHSSRYGLCFCGSYLNGSIVADTIREMLSALRISTPQAVAAESIIEIAFTIYQDVSKHLMGIHRTNGLAQIVIGGYCSIKRQFVFYIFDWTYNETQNEIVFVKKALPLIDGQIAFFGSSTATNAAESLKEKVKFGNGIYTNGYTEYHILRDIINDPSIPDVGGAIQIGQFNQLVFSSWGMVDYELSQKPNSELMYAKEVFLFRGIPLRRSTALNGSVTLDVSRMSMAPFPEKLRELQAKALTINNGK